MLRFSDGQLWGAEAEKWGSTQKWKTEGISSGEDGVKYEVRQGDWCKASRKSWKHVEEMICSIEACSVGMELSLKWHKLTHLQWLQCRLRPTEDMVRHVLSSKPLLFHISFSFIPNKSWAEGNLWFGWQQCSVNFWSKWLLGRCEPGSTLLAYVPVCGSCTEQVSWWVWFFRMISFFTIKLCTLSAHWLMLPLLLLQNPWHFHLNSLAVSKAQHICHQNTELPFPVETNLWLTHAFSGGLTF